MPEYRWIVPEGFGGRKLRSAAVYGLGVSSGLYKRAKFHGQILLDGDPVTADVQVRAGQELILRIPEKENPLPQPSSRPLCVPYEDDYLLLIDKPAPLPTAPSVHQSGETLENAVFSHLGCPEDFVWRPVNRLDKGTSGLLAAAKDARTQDRLQRMLHTEHFRREYLAVVEGRLPEAEGIIDLPIAKEDAASVRRVICEEGRPAVTHYRVLQTSNNRSLVRLRLETGRTHQIRVHMAALGCPVCGDFLYGTELACLPGRFALHSCHLSVLHPVTGQTVTAKSPLPPELAALLRE